jgi:glycosyltransferase involved in cell wall biosynthesis
MCTYNGEQYVEEQLQSILRQTWPPVEIVIGDDGSTDKTLDKIESIAATADVPIRVHRNATRLGYADNFLRACDHVRTRYIAFSDQDDEWMPTKLEKTRVALEREGAVLCVHAVELIDGDGVVLGDNRSRTHARVVPPLRSDPFGNYYGFTMLFERGLLDRIPADERGKDPHTRDASLPHDRWVFFLASTFGSTAVVDECLARYRQHDQQLYGGEQGRTRAERLATKLAEGQSQARYLAEVSTHYAALLESNAPGGNDCLWRAGATRWRTIAFHFARRTRLYDDTTTPRRLARLAGNVRAGSYRSFPKGGLGARRLVEDAVVVAAKALTSGRRAPEGVGR